MLNEESKVQILGPGPGLVELSESGYKPQKEKKKVFFFYYETKEKLFLILPSGAKSIHNYRKKRNFSE